MPCHLLRFPAHGQKEMTPEFPPVHRNKEMLLHGKAADCFLTQVKTLGVA